MTEIQAEIVALACAAVAGEDPGARQGAAPAADALRVFETKCIECHGPEVRKPEGGFCYVTDLVALAGDPALVVPGKPDKSEVYRRLVTGNPKERMAAESEPTSGGTLLAHRWLGVASAPAATVAACWRVAAVRKFVSVLILALLVAACSSPGAGSGGGGGGGTKPYPLGTCLVTGTKLGSMGDPYVKVYGDQEIRFCCEPCVVEFEANPDKFLKMLPK
ncbi:MAG: hypothetical protein HUU06_00595 [Planctomycetaceae bacterium]|nr:hypothetical protein [Planctomycetota bacterium]NUN51270.1 hypothetical protein [Planctomycetaceae bacterium]